MTDWLYIGIRFALYADLMLLFGGPLYCLYARDTLSVLPCQMTAVLASAGVGLSMLAIVAMTAVMSGVELVDVDRQIIATMVADTSVGHAWLVRIVLLIAIMSVSAWPMERKFRLVVPMAAGALASLAWTGHGAAGEDASGDVELVADVVHLWAAGAWVGALAVQSVLLLRPVRRAQISLAHRRLKAFGLAGSIIVGLIVVSGMINGLVLVGLKHVVDLPFTLYGQLLLAKLVLFGAMLGLAATNRFRLTPALEQSLATGDTKAAIRALRFSLAIETGTALAILALVAWLGMLEPPQSM